MRDQFSDDSYRCVGMLDARIADEYADLQFEMTTAVAENNNLAPASLGNIR